MADEKSLDDILNAAEAAKRRSADLKSQSENTAGAKIKNGALDDAAAKAAARHGYKRIKYGFLDFCKKVAEWAVGTKVAKGIKAVGKYSGWTKLWNATKPSKWSWKAEDPNQTSWQTFKNRCKKVMGIATHAWLLAWPLSIVPGLKSVPVAGELALGAQEIGRYWTWEPAMDLFRMGAGAAATGIKNSYHFVKGEAMEPVSLIRKEVVHLNSKNQTDIEEDIWGLQGTRKKGSMDEDDAVFYKAENRLVCQVWNIFNHGSLWLARDKTAPVLIGGDEKAAEVLSFGGDWRLATWLQAKPYFLEMRPVSGEFNTEAGTNQGTTITPTQQETPVAPQPATP